MVTTTSASLLLPSPVSRRSATIPVAAVSTSHLPNRRRSLLLLLTLPAPFLATTVPTSRAENIGLFGIRKKIEKIEQEVVEVVKEGEELVDEEIKTVEKDLAQEIKTAEKGIESAAAAVEAEVEATGAGFQIAGDSVQAGAVAGAEAVGILIGLSVVNGILSPETQK